MHAGKGSSLSPNPVSSRQATFLFLRRSEQLEMNEQETLITLRHLHPEIDLAYDLVQQFALMLRTRTAEQLDNWLEKVGWDMDGQAFLCCANACSTLSSLLRLPMTTGNGTRAMG